MSRCAADFYHPYAALHNVLHWQPYTVAFFFLTDGLPNLDDHVPDAPCSKMAIDGFIWV